MDDAISRKWLMECVDEGWIKFDTEKDTNTYIHLVRDIAPPAQPKSNPCEVCKYLEDGDTLYQSSDWDGGIGFDYIRDIRYCPKCGRRL